MGKKGKFVKAKNLVEKAKTSGVKKDAEMGDCIAHLSDAIQTMERIVTKSAVKEEINQSLCEAYCVRALFEHKANPKSEEILKDLKVALSLWLNADTLPSIMFYNIIDLVQMKGSVELVDDVYSLLIKIFKETSTDSMDWFTTLWFARRLNHPFCSSPVNEKLIKEYIEPCLSKELQESLSSLYKKANDNEDHFLQQVSKETDPNSYTFAQAYAHLEKSKWHTSTGDIKEALSHAYKSQEYFGETALKAQEVISKEIVVCLLKNTTVNFNDTYITPWKAIQGYLECLLQLGIILEMMGHGFEAESILLEGLNICNSYEFPLPHLFFSIHIEKLYARGLTKLPNKVNLPDAMGIFKNSRGQWGCLKCNSLIQCTLYGDHGDLLKTKSTANAKKEYTKAVTEINSSLWQNKVSCHPVEANEAFRANAWQDLSSHVSKSKSLDDLVNLKWECVRRQLAVELYIGLGECYSESEDEARKILLQNISLLAGINPFHHTPTSIDMNWVAIENPGDMFSIQRAKVIHSISWYCLKNHRTDFVRKKFGRHLQNKKTEFGWLCSIIFARIVSSLKVAFVLSRGVPLILREVSTLLSVMFVVSCSSKKLSLASICNDLTVSVWSAYFHQISIGTNLTNRFHLELTEIFKGQPVSESSSMFDSVGYIPNSTTDLTAHVRKFMVGLSSATITCLSVLGSKYVGLLKELPLCHSIHRDTNAIMLVSQLNFMTDPFTMIQQIPKDLEVDKFLKRLRRTVEHVSKPKMQNIQSFHADELRRNGDLSKELSDLEESWFGPWKCMFQGQALDCEIMDNVLKDLLQELSHISDSVHVIESLLKLILESSQFFEVNNLEAGLRTMNGSCFIAKNGYYEALSAMLPKKPSDNKFETAFKHAFGSMKGKNIERKPIIFVFDSQLQTIPWENMPVGRDQEIYRMPSVSSVFTVLEYHKRRNTKEQLGRNSVLLPSMDPLDAFYVINPQNDPEISFDSVEPIIKCLEGCKNCEPTDEELTLNIKKHDLFMYYGHKMALPISKKHINSVNTEKESCAVVKLMGCETIDYQLQGRYAPKCSPYSYLLVGSPAVFANLWMVTDQEIELLGVALYRKWVEERSNDKGKHGVAAFMPQARLACRYPFLTGAATVCYGVPTKICKKDSISSQLSSKRKHSE